ncbi:hypothetical protein [Corallibacter sp.]|uniref:hypothetical protein n=1 Tax=Corallibacter sp. TaxID=2038084 RepID=UPI003AB70CED
MKIKLLPFFGFLLLSFSGFSQEKLELGRYITSDKLKYITIKSNYEFEYLAYKGYSPYTIKEERKKENKPQMCGTVGYWGDGRGKGTYSIEDGILILKFEIDNSTIASKKIDTRFLKGLSFEILELEKLETENQKD